MNIKNVNGQYFTTDFTLKKTVSSFIQNNPKLILEPSVGRGDLVEYILQDNKIQFDMYELDSTLDFKVDKKQIIFGDFLKQHVTKKYKTIIGNPPYLKTKNGNLYIHFIRRCYTLLMEGGELIFIVPFDFFKLTQSRSLLQEMLGCGRFTHIYHPNKENLFKNATIDVVVFRYQKKTPSLLFNGEKRYLINSNGMVTFEKNPVKNKVKLSEYFDVYVGLISAAEKIFKHPTLGNMEVLNKKDKIEKYIHLSKFPSSNKKVNDYLLTNKEYLLKRKIRAFDEKNWFEWGAFRNSKVMEQHKKNICLYVHTLTREDTIAFKGKTCYFGGGLLMLKPKKKCNLKKIVNYLNSNEFKAPFMSAGRFKIGQKQLCDSHIKI